MKEDILNETYVDYKGFHIEVSCACTYGKENKNGWYAVIYAPNKKFPNLFIHHVLWANPLPNDEDRSSYEKILAFAKKEIDLPNFRLRDYIK